MDESTEVIDLPRESLTTPPEVTTSISPISAPKRTIQREKKFTDAVIVRRLQGDDLLVPMSAEGVKNANIITAELCRDLLEKTIDRYKEQDKTPTSKELGELVNAGKAVMEMAGRAHEGGELNAPGPDGLLGGTPAISSPSQIIDLFARIKTLGK